MSEQTSTKQLVIGGAVALAVAAVVLVVFVLPAEFGVDPTGAGEATGLADLASAGEMTELERGALREGVMNLRESDGMRIDRASFELRPYEMVEYKYTMEEGAPLVFTWTAEGGEVNFDMHAHPFDGGVELTESYTVGDGAGQSGHYIAAFTGIHGWYWHNRTLENVTVTINAAGFFTATTIFDESGEFETPVDPAD